MPVAVDDGQVGVESTLEPAVAGVAEVGPDHELVRPGGHRVGGLDVHLLFESGLLALLAGGGLLVDLLVAAGRGRGQAELPGEVLQRLEHVRDQAARLGEGDRLSLARAGHAGAVRRPVLSRRVTAVEQREGRGAELPRQAGDHVLPPVAGAGRLAPRCGSTRGAAGRAPPFLRDGQRGVVQAGDAEQVRRQAGRHGERPVVGVQRRAPAAGLSRRRVLLDRRVEGGVDLRHRGGGPDVVPLRVGRHRGEPLRPQPAADGRRLPHTRPEPGGVGIGAEEVPVHPVPRRADRVRVTLRGGQVRP